MARSKEIIRKVSIKKYHHPCAFNLATQEHMQHQRHNQENFRFTSKLPALKTSNLTDFSKAASIRLSFDVPLTFTAYSILNYLNFLLSIIVKTSLLSKSSLFFLKKRYISSKSCIQ